MVKISTARGRKWEMASKAIRGNGEDRGSETRQTKISSSDVDGFWRSNRAEGRARRDAATRLCPLGLGWTVKWRALLSRWTWAKRHTSGRKSEGHRIYLKDASRLMKWCPLPRNFILILFSLHSKVQTYQMLLEMGCVAVKFPSKVCLIASSRALFLILSSYYRNPSPSASNRDPQMLKGSYNLRKQKEKQ